MGHQLDQSARVCRAGPVLQPWRDSRRPMVLGQARCRRQVDERPDLCASEAVGGALDRLCGRQPPAVAATAPAPCDRLRTLCGSALSEAVARCTSEAACGGASDGRRGGAERRGMGPAAQVRAVCEGRQAALACVRR